MYLPVLDLSLCMTISFLERARKDGHTILVSDCPVYPWVLWVEKKGRETADETQSLMNKWIQSSIPAEYITTLRHYPPFWRLLRRRQSVCKTKSRYACKELMAATSTWYKWLKFNSTMDFPIVQNCTQKWQYYYTNLDTFTMLIEGYDSQVHALTYIEVKYNVVLRWK